MPDRNSPLKVAILMVPGVTASTVYGMYDLFASTGRDWEMLVEGSPGNPAINAFTVSVDGRRFQAGNGVWLEPDFTLDDAPAPDVICIPELLVDPDADPSGCNKAEIHWINLYYSAGSTLATVCSGALLLAEAGLLDGQDATTHWGFIRVLESRYPEIRVHPNRALVVSGEEQRIVMAGGGTTWLDLALFLVARFIGVEAAMRVARVNLIDWHDIGQQPFAALTLARQVDDAVIAKCQHWVGENYDHESPVARMVEHSGLTERTFKRRFAKATGRPWNTYIRYAWKKPSKCWKQGIFLWRLSPTKSVMKMPVFSDACFVVRSG